MALPNNAASSVGVSDLMLPPDDQVTTPLEDFERGGIAVNNPSAGLNARDWRCFVDETNGADVYLQPAGGVAVLIFSVPGVTAVTFTFDQQMRPAVVYRLGSSVLLRWFDPTQNSFVTTNYGDLKDPKLSFDDKRITQVADRGDIIFAYLRQIGGTLGLYYRQQRDRFNIEYTLRTGLPVNTRLRAVGMNRNLRMQFETV